MPVATLPPCPSYLGKEGGGLSKSPLGGCPVCTAPLGGCGCECCQPVWKDCFPNVSPSLFMLDFSAAMGSLHVTLNRQNDFAPVTFPTVPAWTGTPTDLATMAGGFLLNTIPSWPNREYIIRPQCVWQSDFQADIPGYGPGVFYLFGGGLPVGLSTEAWVTLLWVYVYPGHETIGFPEYSGISLRNCVGMPRFDPTMHNSYWPGAYAGLDVDVYPA